MEETRELGQLGAQVSLSDRASNHPVTPNDAAVPNDASARTPVTQAAVGTGWRGRAPEARIRSSPGEGPSWPRWAPRAGAAGFWNVEVSPAAGEPLPSGTSDRRSSGSSALERARSSRSPVAWSDGMLASLAPDRAASPAALPASSIVAGWGWRSRLDNHFSQSSRTKAGQLESAQTSNCSFDSRERPAFIDFCAASCESTQAALSKACAVAGALNTASTTIVRARIDHGQNGAMPCWPSGNLGPWRPDIVDVLEAISYRK